MKKIICIMLSFLLSASLMGCGSSTEGETTFTNEETLQQSDDQYYSENTEETKTPTLPTYDEAFEYIKKRYYNENTWTEVSETSFIGPKEEVITATPSIGSIVYRADGVVTSIYYDDDFERICSLGDDIDSAWEDICAFYEDFSGFELELTCEELESNMQEYESAAKYTIYKYEHNRFSYTVTVNRTGVYIEAKPTF